MRILSAAEALDFEHTHEKDLWFYEDARLFRQDAQHDIYHVSGVFNSILRHPDYGAVSTVSNDKFIVFEDNGQYAVIALDKSTSDYVVYVSPIAHDIVEVMCTTYLRRYNDNNLLAFPPLRELEVEKKSAKKTTSKKRTSKTPSEVDLQQ